MPQVTDTNFLAGSRHRKARSGFWQHSGGVRRDRDLPGGSVSVSDTRRRALRVDVDPLIVGMLAAAISLGGAARPSFWYDEAATISASYSRSLGQLWRMLGNVDAVHGLYYVLMHGWFQIFPPTEFWSRAPSGLAAGGAAAGVVVLGRQFSSRTVAVASGVVCAILPRTTWAGIEARPYALSMMTAVWLTVLLVVAAHRESRWLWLCYGIGLAVSILLDMYLALLLIAHVVFVFAFRRSRTVVVPFAITSLLTGGILAPFVHEVVGQVQQIKWIAPIGHRTIEDVVVQQYFERSPLFAVLSALVIAAAIVLWLSGSAQLREADRQLLTIAVIWLVVPTALIVIWSAIAHPIYTPRYLAFTAPAMALVLGVCIGALAVKPWAAPAIVILLAVAGTPNYVLAQRNP